MDFIFPWFCRGIQGRGTLLNLILPWRIDSREDPWESPQKWWDVYNKELNIPSRVRGGKDFFDDTEDVPTILLEEEEELEFTENVQVGWI